MEDQIILKEEDEYLTYDIKENLMKALKQIFEYNETIQELVVDYGYKRVTYRFIEKKESKNEQG